MKEIKKIAIYAVFPVYYFFNNSGDLGGILIGIIALFFPIIIILPFIQSEESAIEGLVIFSFLSFIPICSCFIGLNDFLTKQYIKMGLVKGEY